LSQGRNTRQPRQTRSQLTKEKVLEAAFRLFCEHGYYQTTTNHIAESAGVSIGSLYAYYKDREEILSDLLVKFDSSLNQALDELRKETELCTTDTRLWIRMVIERMSNLRQSTRGLHIQLRSIQYTSPKVALVLGRHKAREIQVILSYLLLNRAIIRVEDLDAAAFIVHGMIDIAVDANVFPEEKQESQAIINATVEAIYRYLFD
jgi:AcrR family transcriptional regulator